MELKDLKEKYLEVEKKYKLPSFTQVNEDFDIDKIDRESDLLVRNVRKIMMEKLINSLNFIEMLLNPVNSPRIYLNYIKNLSLEDKTLIEEIYSVLSDLSVLALDLEIDYNEKTEATLVKKIFSDWQELKPKFRKIFANMKKPNNVTSKKEKSYFG